MRPLASNAAWCAGLAAALIGVGRAPERFRLPITEPSQIGSWVRTHDAHEIVGGVLGLTAAVFLWYLAAATIVAIVAAAARAPVLDSIARRVTPALVRAIVADIASASVVTGALLGAQPAAHLSNAIVSAPIGSEDEPAGTATMRVVADEPAQKPTPQRVEVVPGDSFWTLAEMALADAWSRPPTDPQVAAYWKELILLNQARLAVPGEPDLIFVGQELDLPPIPPAP
jgi:hypothetical protein